MSLLRFLGLGGSGAGREAEPESLTELAAELEFVPEEEARFVAAFAFLLARIAGADLRIDPSETETIAEHLEHFGGVTKDQSRVLAKSAIRTSESKGASDNHLVARTFGDIASREDQIRLLRCLYAVAAADESISTQEDNEIFEVAFAIGLSREEVVAIRSEFKEYLGTMKALPTER